MNIVIVGQGAIGLLWHVHLNKLVQNHASVSLLPSRQLKDSNKQSIRYNYTHYQGLSEQCQYQIAQRHHLANAEVILVCVKSYQVKDVINDIAANLAKNAIIILAHNGMGTLADINDSIRTKHPILALLTTHGCARPMPAHILHTGLGHSDLGILSGCLTPAQITKLTKLLNQALPSVTWQDNIISKQWQKLAVNCVINPLTALHNVNNGAMKLPEFTKIIHPLIAEFVTIANAEGEHFKPQKILATVMQVADATANNCSSMRADLIAQRPTEIDYINGYIHRLGIKHKIATPINTQLWQQIKDISADNNYHL